MIKKFQRVMFLAVALFAMAGSVLAQQMPPIPLDTAVRIGHLPNGMTYYIRHNEKPKGQADFYIAQKVGSILEEENQRGLAHFLEHMCFNGSENFPGNSMIKWLESVGVKFGSNLNAYTGIDETVYNISNVPVARKEVQDSCLLILHDWANAITLDPEEIDKERGVIHEEWRRSMVGQMRILEKILPTMYPNSRYGERLPIGIMEVVDNFPPQAIRDYYETWYRPDQQGLVIVGDIDVDYIENKIKEVFSGIEMPENPKERVYFPVEDTPGTIYAIGSDPEQTVGIAQIMFKTDAIPDEAKTTIDYLIIKYILGMVEGMLDQRLSDMANLPDAPFAQAGANYGEYFVARTKDAFSVSSVAKGDDVLPGFEAAYRELLRAARGGFTVGEYERAKAEYLSRLEKYYNSRESRESGSYVQEYVNNFLHNEPIPSIEDEYQIMTQIIPMLPVEAVNSILPEVITPDNRVVMAMVPEKGGFKMPTEEEFAAVIAKVEAEDIEPYKDTMKEEPLVQNLPAPGKVVSVIDVPQWGAKLITLSNGVKVYVKNTDFKKDEILFTALAKGGTSVIGEDQANSLIVLPLGLSEHGLGTYNSIDLQKYLQGKQANVSFSLENYLREVGGSSTVKDLPTLMELIYMTFTDFQIFPEEYEAAKQKYAGILANQEANPEFAFNKAVSSTLFKSAAKAPLTAEIVRESDYKPVLKIIRDNLSNAADYTFFFVGDVTVEQIEPLLEKYIAVLPADAKTATTAYVPNLDREITPGSGTDISTTKMETPQTYCAIIVQGAMPYNTSEKTIASTASQILSNRLLHKIREEMGATYSIGAYGGMNRQGNNNTFIQIVFPMKPEMKNEVLAEIHKMVHEMAQNVTDDELNPIKEYMVKSAVEGKEKNNDWLDAMVGASINGIDTFNDNIDAINAITVADVMKYMDDLLKQANYRVVILDPAE